MLNRIYALSAAVFAAGFLAANLPAADTVVTQTDTTITHTADLSGNLPAGITAKDLNENKDIEKLFAKATEDALSKNGFDNLTGLLVDQDRTRIKDSLDKGRSLTNVNGDDNRGLNEALAGIDGFWQKKYNAKFDPAYDKAFGNNFLGIKTGEVSDPAALVGHWPLDASMMVSNPGAGKMGADDLNQARKTFGGEVNLEKGRNVAIAHLPMSHGMPGLNISMIHEAGGWKFDIPNNLDAKKLYANLENNLNFVKGHEADLPGEVNDGYRMVSHAVVAALYDIDLSKIKTPTALDTNGVRPAGESVQNRP